MEYLEERKYKYLVIHHEDEYDPDNRMGLLFLKIVAKQVGIGWLGKSLLIVSPEYWPLHSLLAILTNMDLIPDQKKNNHCAEFMICKDNCLGNSLKATRFDDHPNNREDVLDISTCLGDKGCMVCILKCPFLKNGE